MVILVLNAPLLSDEIENHVSSSNLWNFLHAKKNYENSIKASFIIEHFIPLILLYNPYVLNNWISNCKYSRIRVLSAILNVFSNLISLDCCQTKEVKRHRLNLLHFPQLTTAFVEHCVQVAYRFGIIRFLQTDILGMKAVTCYQCNLPKIYHYV